MEGVHDLLKLILSLEGRAPAQARPASLDALFRELSMTRPRRPPQEVESLVWSAWSSHPVKEAEQALEAATRAIAREQYDRARRLLDPLLDEYPQWAEAWNKRATLFYLQGRDAESFDDIRRTLELEPRHFGAICGFAQICLRRGERAAALSAFEVALAINPHLSGVHAAVEDLRESLADSLH
jgi:tetratricopeptide (TPR) repeat protein